MRLSWFENLIFGLVSGLTEFLPVSTGAHQAILLKLFGVWELAPVHTLIIHAGVFCGLILYSLSDLIRIRREMRLARIPIRKRKRQPDMRIVLDRRILGSGAFLAAAGGIVSGYFGDKLYSLSTVCIMLAVNGTILFLPSLYSAGNKDSRHFSPADGWLFGLCAGFGMLPGLSRMALVSSAVSLRGADRQTACRYGILLGIPSFAGLLAADLYRTVILGFGTLSFGMILSLVAAFLTAGAGAYISLSLIKNIAARRSNSAFSYYCWGAALLALILHLSVS